MHRLFNLCLWQVLFAGVLLTSAPTISAQETGVSIRGPKSTDVYPYRRYGPINSNDTLWKVATKIRPSEKVSIYQVMQAIFELNPNAFANNNINHLIDGAYLVIPTLADVRVVDENQARKKSQSDSKAWQSLDKNIKAVEKKAVEKTASRKDLEEAKVEINEQLQSFDDQQKGRLDTIQRDVLDSIDGLQAILKENESLKKRLGDFNEQLGTMQNEVAKGQEVKRHMDDMLALQRELLAKVEERERQLLLEKEQAFTSGIWFKVLLGTIPTLLILSLVIFFLRKKKQPQEAPQEVEMKTTSQAVAEPPEVMEPDDTLSLDGELSLDDELTLDLTEDEDSSDLFSDDLDDELSDELTDDDVIHLDDLDDLDELDDLEDISLDENLGDDLDESDDLTQQDSLAGEEDEGEPLESGELEQGALDDLLSGLDDAGESEPLEGGELGQGDLDDLLSDLDDDEGEPLEGGELGQGDLDDLLSGLGDDLSADEDDKNAEEVNVDDFIGEASDGLSDSPELPDGSDVTDPDDIDALLAAAAPETSTAVDDIADGSDVTDPDDIDALLAAAAPETSATVDDIADGSDVTDPDDIDALLAAAAPETSTAVDDIADGSDVTDPDDIDALLAAAAPETSTAVDDIADGSDVTDPDDIDALLAAAAPETSATVDDIADGSDVTDPDDIDALLAAAAPETSATVDDIADGSDVTDPDDIDAIINSLTNEVVEEAPQSREITDPDEINALLEQEPVDDFDDASATEDKPIEAESEHKSLIENFSEEYVAPFLQVDFSEINNEAMVTEGENADEVVTVDPAIDKLLNIEPNVDPKPDNNDVLSDDIDIDSLISDVQAGSDDVIDIGDDILGTIDEFDEQSTVDDETLSAMESDFDESTLSELLKEENDLAPPLELTPDFTDSNVLADLLDEGEVKTQEVSEANVIEDIQELDSLDFDELLANIEESSTGSDDAFDVTDELDIDDGIDLGDDLDVGIHEDINDIATQDDFVSVDSLLSDSLDNNKDEEPYTKANIDVGLNEFPEFTDDINDVDVDDDDNGIAAKLDLAKVYIEIGDKENAEIILQDVVKLGDAQQQYDAQQLLDSL